jgi:polysaccharide biosynthesis/export protein
VRRQCMIFSLLVLLAQGLAAAQVSQPTQAANGMQSGGAAAGSSSASRAASGAMGPIAAPEDIARIRIAPGFVLQVGVFDEPDMETSSTVDQSGLIALPLAGQVQVGGQTIEEARKSIEAALIERKILLHPQVTVSLVQYVPYIVAVMGEVQNQGRLQLIAPHTLLDVISLAGGATALAGGSVLLRHTVDGVARTDSYPYRRGGDGTEIAQVMVRDGDTVIVPRAGIVYVLGSVNRPGGYLMQEDGDLDVMQALALAMGTSLQAKVGSIRVLRRNADSTWVEIPVDYREISKGKRIPLRLQAQDIVYVPISKPKAIFTSSSSIIGQTGSAVIYAVR